MNYKAFFFFRIVQWVHECTENLESIWGDCICRLLAEVSGEDKVEGGTVLMCKDKDQGV